MRSEKMKVVIKVVPNGCTYIAAHNNIIIDSNNNT